MRGNRVNPHGQGISNPRRNLDFFKHILPTTLCPFKVSGGLVFQNAQGNFGAQNSDVYPNWNLFFTGRAPVFASYEGLGSNVEMYLISQNEAGNLTQSANLGMYNADATLTLIKPVFDAEKDHLSIANAKETLQAMTFKFWTIPEYFGNTLFYISNADYYRTLDTASGEMQLLGIQYTFKKLTSEIDNVDNPRHKNYVHFGGVASKYMMPSWDGYRVTELEVTPPEVSNVQIEIYGLGGLSGAVILTDEDLDANVSDDGWGYTNSHRKTKNIYVPSSALPPNPSAFFESTPANQAPEWYLDGGPVMLGEWSDWKSSVRANYASSERPNFEGVWKWEKEITDSTKSNNNFLGWYLYNANNQTYISNTNYVWRGDPSFLREIHIYVTTDKTKAKIYSYKWQILGEGNVGFSVRRGLIYTERTEFKVFYYLENVAYIPTNFPQRWHPIDADQNAEYFKPLNSGNQYNFGINPIETSYFSNPFIATNLTQTQFLGWNSIANLDTPILPVEITENVPFDLSSIPIFGPILSKLTLGVPLGFNYRKTTTRQFYDRKYHVLFPRVAMELMSKGIYGSGDASARKVPIELFKDAGGQPFLSPQAFNSTYNFIFGKFGNYVKAGSAQGAIYGFGVASQGIEAPANLHSTTQAIILFTVGYVEIGLTFYEKNGGEVWQTHITSQAKYNQDLRQWMTIIPLAPEVY